MWYGQVNDSFFRLFGAPFAMRRLSSAMSYGNSASGATLRSSAKPSPWAVNHHLPASPSTKVVSSQRFRIA
jgi:hypothetical protein